MLRRQLIGAALGAGLLLAPFTGALAWEGEIEALKQRWEQITTQQAEGERRRALQSLANEAEQLAEANAGEAQPLIWLGIIEASHARERSGLGALGSARSARDALERAIELDPQGGNGSAYVTLGALYDRAPGRPVGFGNSDTAEQMFQRALEIRPDGIDVNYYYATFLEDEGRQQEAREHAQRAVDGMAREDRQASDEALREEARALLSRL
ncbi:TRAP transporter TatT component family protein [Billgrantia kenyensis]|uniref:Tetratricopeptide repeat protein n=1 Tax=Billgrantia kenyensis TaxID=321266 RepID=A0A7V9W178_9GAMM|nr:TRAP transporter TatT component family protein [Halomonas kenyensis]MBA2779179.1 hypothetical protein [Halomonas kenyensis]MCG6660819.1 hypothetical protein [Halomonas kenyensis]